MLKHLRDHKQEIYPRLEKLSGELVEGVAAAAKDAGVALCCEPRGVDVYVVLYTGAGDGLGFGFEIEYGSVWRSSFASMLDSGVYLPPSQYEAAFLGAAHTEEDVQRTIAAARAGICGG